MRKPILASIAVCALMSAFFIAGCGSTSVAAPPTPTATATTPPTPSPTPVLDSTFTSPDGAYTFQFPGSWSSTPINTSPVVNGVLLVSADSQNLFVTAPLTEGLPSSQYVAFFQSFLKGAGGTNIKTKSDGTVTLGQNTWTVEEATLTFKGSAYDAAQFALAHHGKSFFVIVMAPHATSDSVGTTYFQPMITSLTFLK